MSYLMITHNTAPGSRSKLSQTTSSNPSSQLEVYPTSLSTKKYLQIAYFARTCQLVPIPRTLAHSIVDSLQKISLKVLMEVRCGLHQTLFLVKLLSYHGRKAPNTRWEQRPAKKWRMKQRNCKGSATRTCLSLIWRNLSGIWNFGKKIFKSVL